VATLCGMSDGVQTSEKLYPKRTNVRKQICAPRVMLIVRKYFKYPQLG